MPPDLSHRSPNYSARTSAIRAIVLHSGTGTKQSDLAWLCDPRSGVSSHYYVDRAGTVYQLVDDQHTAWHAGNSYWLHETNLNPFSIGVELEHTSRVHADYTVAQLASLRSLCRDLIERYGIAHDWIVAHRWIAPDRRFDPEDWDDTDLKSWIMSLYNQEPQPGCYRRYRVKANITRIRALPTIYTTILAELDAGNTVRGVPVLGSAYKGDRHWVYLDIGGYVWAELLDEANA